MTASQMEATAKGATLTQADGRVVYIPKPDYTLRTDLWADAFDGTYRFWLDLPMTEELETKFGKGIFAIYGSVARGRYELEGKSVGFANEGAASLPECRAVIWMALAGGKVGIVDGAEVKVDANRARQLVDRYLVSAPAEQSWDLAFLILHTAVLGRKERPEEAGTRSSEAVPPVTPDATEAA